MLQCNMLFACNNIMLIVYLGILMRPPPCGRSHCACHNSAIVAVAWYTVSFHQMATGWARLAMSAQSAVKNATVDGCESDL